MRTELESVPYSDCNMLTHHAKLLIFNRSKGPIMQTDTECNEHNSHLKTVRPGMALVLGFFMGGSIGLGLMIISMLLFWGYVFDLFFFFVVATILGSATGGIFGLISYPFVRNMDIPKVVFCLASGTFLTGLIASIASYIYWGLEIPLLSWPAGMLGYVVTFLFRHELVSLINRWQARHKSR